MHKGFRGYLTVEASFVMPIVIWIYLLVILCGFYLYNRCVMSQNDYLLAFRGSRFTDARENYGEVIYGDAKEKEPDEQYITTRLSYKMKFYPFCRVDSNKVKITADQVCVETSGYGGYLKVEKKSERINIAKIIERTRCNS